MQYAKEKKESKKAGIGKKRTGRNSRQHWRNIVSWRFGWIGRRKVKRQIKDRLFRFLFEKDKEALLQLYREPSQMWN